LGNRLQQVVWNLLSNAVKFTPSNGRVEVSLEQAGFFALIKVSDIEEVEGQSKNDEA
jgi:signal transduction histidine kinase